MRKLVLLSLAAAALTLCGCQKQSNSTGAAAATNNAAPAAPSGYTNGAARNPGSGK